MNYSKINFHEKYYVNLSLICRLPSLTRALFVLHKKSLLGEPLLFSKIKQQDLIMIFFGEY